MLTVQGVSYTHPDGDLLFSGINFAINKSDKIALIGNNGSGKSTLLKIMSGILAPTEGLVKADSRPYYLPQVMGQFNHLTIAQALGLEDKLSALKEILNGHVTDASFSAVDNDWTIEERCNEAFAHWDLHGIDLYGKMQSLSGGQKTRIFLAGMMIHQPEIVLLDEPSNHLDPDSRNVLYRYVTSTNHALVVVSHDRSLLNSLEITCEIGERGITTYGGNYDFYSEQKQIENNALQNDLKSKEKALRKAKEMERESLERQQKLDARGKKKQEKAGMPTIMLNTLRNNAEKSTARVKDAHAGKVNGINRELNELRKEIQDIGKMKLDLDNSTLHKGKVLVTAENINFAYDDHMLWREDLTFQIRCGERIAVKGSNGSGKTTLVRLIRGEFKPKSGTIEIVPVNTVYIDQDYSLIDNTLSVYDQAQRYNVNALQEHEVKIRLNRFLFSSNDWDKPCSALSGGEKMRLMLCSLTIATKAPDMIILDEPTNNLDIQNIKILTTAINEYTGTLIVISHDAYFLKEVCAERSMPLIGNRSASD